MAASTATRIAIPAAAAALTLVLAAACATASGSQATRLSIAFYPHGRTSSLVHRYRLGCNPAGGTVPKPGRACRALMRLRHPFAPIPRGEICAQIALGPQEAIVTGQLHGDPVSAHLSLRNSCQIARWHRLADVVPGFPRSP